MKVLIALTYYRPHVSGLTIYVERLARALVDRGHSVTVLTSQYDPRLPRRQMADGVQVLRVPVALRVSKGVVMPTIGLVATRQVLAHDVLSLHLPQLDAAGIALRGRTLGRPTVLTYHSDLHLPPGFTNRVANGVVDAANRIAGALADAVVAYTSDFAEHSPFLSRYTRKLRVIPPPVQISSSGMDSSGRLEGLPPDGKPVIGMAARLASEKGVEHLLGALPAILARHPEARVLFAGPYEKVLGEAAYAERLAPLLERFSDRWTFLGTLDSSGMAAFYRQCDVTVLPSVNSTETFGLVQIESMLCGTPVVASDLPGVRQPVLTTGMGKIVPIGDADSLARALLEVLDHPGRYVGDLESIARFYSPGHVAAEYEALFESLLRRGVGADGS